MKVPRMTVSDVFKNWDSEEAGPGDRVQVEGVMNVVCGRLEDGEVPIECWLSQEHTRVGNSESIKVFGELGEIRGLASPIIGGDYSTPTYYEPVLMTGKLAWCDFAPYRIAMVHLERIVFTNIEPNKELILDDSPKGHPKGAVRRKEAHDRSWNEYQEKLRLESLEEEEE